MAAETTSAWRALARRKSPSSAGCRTCPGIGVAMRLTPGLGVHLRGLADELLVNDFPGATIQRHEREMLATAVSAANDCFFCMDSHGALAGALLEREDAVRPRAADRRGQDRLVGRLRSQDAGPAAHRADGPARRR